MTSPFALPSVDPLGEALHSLRMSGAFYCRSELSAPWGVALPAMDSFLMFHFVAAGRCRLEVAGAEPRTLQAGDLALVPHGQGHRLLSEAGAPCEPLFDIPRVSAGERYELIHHGGGGATTSLICGAVRFSHPAATHLVRLLPRVICIDPLGSPHDDWLQSTLRFMAAEARALQPGGEAVITRLADIVVIQAIRSWIAHDPAAQAGWLAGLQDRQIGRAIAAIHRDPARTWTLESLAAEVAMSRSAFAARFTELVGQPPMQYLGHWRMHIARTWLEEHDEPLASLAGRVGYQSEAAFSRAFKRMVGVSPGSVVRRRQPAAAP
ncbi:MAG TPA: AraC family transcriptional regulator [Rhizobacter sp.]|nr:AraC family transcriptional regulator [Rhizobacter sp.]